MHMLRLLAATPHTASEVSARLPQSFSDFQERMDRLTMQCFKTLRILSVFLLAFFFITLPATDARWAFADTKEIRLLSGAGLRQPVEQLVAAFQRETGIKVTVEFGGSGKILARYRVTGKGDVFLPGSFFYVKRLIDEGEVVSSRRIAFHTPVVAVNKGRSELVKSFSDLAKPGVKVGLGDPKAMALGRTAEDILQNSGMKEKILKNVVVRAGTVKQLALYVSKGDVDAGIIARADAFQNPETMTSFEIDPSWYTPEIIAAAALKTAEHPNEADKLVEYLSSPMGKQTFEKFGFKPFEAR